MRQVLSLSLPTTKVREVKSRAKHRGFASVSSYVQYLLKTDEDLISEAELLRDVAASDREYAQGKSIKAKSIADLL